MCATAIGKSITMLDARERVTGQLPYMANLRLENMLFMKVFRSSYPHGRILQLDASKAEKIPGVAAVMTATDFDLPGGPKLYGGAFLKDHPTVAKDKVRYVGEPIVLVAAENIRAAEHALKFIHVEYEELPSVLNAYESMQPGAPILHDDLHDNCFTHAKLHHGDLEAGFAAADEIIEETYTSPFAQHTSLEPHITAALWKDGKLTVWTGSQAPSTLQQALAEMFNLQIEDVRIIVPPLGGGYGGKGQFTIEPITAAMAWKANGRPVKLALTREEEFVNATKHAATFVIKSGFKLDGTITARQVTAYWGCGAYADISPVLVKASLVRALGPYRLPAARVDAYGVYTNTPSAVSFRGAMTSQATWAYESHTDTIAAHLSMGSVDFRKKNLLREGDEFVTGEILHDIHFDACLEAVVKGLDWEHSPHLPRKEGHILRGRGVAVMMKSTPATSKSQCRLVLDQEGRLTLYTSTVEMGQGSHTALAQIAASVLGLPIDALRVIGPDTALTPFDSTTSASRSTTMMGTAIQNAAEQLKQKLKQISSPQLECEQDDLTVDSGFVYSNAEPEHRLSYRDVLQRNSLSELEADGEYSVHGEIDPETGRGIGALHYHQGAGACVVEVDIETGKVRVLRYQASAFAGQVVNPTLADLQNIGNVIYGMGPTLMEEIIYNAGRPIDHNLDTYQIPAFEDVPEMMGSHLLEAEGSGFQGVGEMALPPVSPAIANAIYDAIGVRIYDLPITPEKVLRALENARA